MKHKTYGGSTAGRLLQCAGFLKASDGIPNTSSAYAHRGSDLHTIQETLRKKDLFPEELDISQLLPDLTPEELAEYSRITEQVFTWTEEVLNDYDLDLYHVEPYVLSNDETGGSIDLFAYNKEFVLVLDYKFGSIQVPAYLNPQGLFYHMSLEDDPRYTKLVTGKKLLFAIIQPNQREPQLWEIPDGELKLFRERYKKAVALSKCDNPPQAAGKECQFCRARPICAVHRGYAKRAITLDPQDKTALQEALYLADQLGNWTSKVYSFAQEMMEHGEQVAGYKLVAKQAKRVWSDPDEVKQALKGAMHKDQYFKQTLLSPAQMEKLPNVPKRLQKVFEERTYKHSSGVTIVPDSDKREPVSFEVPENLKALFK